MPTTKTIPAIVNLQEAIAKFYQDVYPLLDPESLASWNGVMLKRRELLILQAGLRLVGHCIAILIYKLALNASVQMDANLSTRGKAGLNYMSQGKRNPPITLIGSVEVRVPVVYKLARKSKGGQKRKVGQRGKSQGQGFYPVFALLGIANGVSPLVRCLVAEAATQAPSFEQARPRIAWLGLFFSKERIRRISEAFCQIGVAERAQRLANLAANNLPLGHILGGKRVAIAVDGGRMNIRQTFINERRSGWPSYESKWREPKLLIIYTLDEEGRKESYQKLTVMADGTLFGKDQFLKILKLYLHQLGIQLAEHVVLLGDGAHWIWDHIPSLLIELGCLPEQLTQTLDYCHAVQHLYSAGEALFGKQEGQKWARKWAQKLKKGSALRLVHELDDYIKKQIYQDLATLQREYNYFHNHQINGRLDYAHSKSQFLPTGSGVVESLIRQVVNLRLKGCSKPWLLENGESFLLARCQWAIHQWDNYCDTILTFDQKIKVSHLETRNKMTTQNDDQQTEKCHLSSVNFVADEIKVKQVRLS